MPVAGMLYERTSYGVTKTGIGEKLSLRNDIEHNRSIGKDTAAGCDLIAVIR